VYSDFNSAPPCVTGRVRLSPSLSQSACLLPFRSIAPAWARVWFQFWGLTRALPRSPAVAAVAAAATAVAPTRPPSLSREVWLGLGFQDLGFDSCPLVSGHRCCCPSRSPSPPPSLDRGLGFGVDGEARENREQRRGVGGLVLLNRERRPPLFVSINFLFFSFISTTNPINLFL